MMSCVLSLGLLLAAQDAASPTPRVLPLTLQQCIQQVEQNSLPLRAEEVDVQIAAQREGQALGRFDTVAFLDVNYAKDITPSASALQTGNLGGTPTPEVQVVGILSKQWSVATGFRGTATSGATYQADLNWSKSFRSAGTFGNFNPAYTTDIGASITQPLLRGFGTTVNKAELMKARNTTVSTHLGLEESRLQRARDVILAYWDYYFAQRTLETRVFLVEQGEELVRINTRKKEVGEMTRIDVVEAQAELAQRQQQVLVAKNEIGRTADALKRLIFAFDERAEWEVEIVTLTDAAADDFAVPNWNDAAKVALDRRPELKRQRELLRNNDIDIVVAENALLPQLDLTASLRFNQLADSKGMALNYTDDFYSVGGGISLEFPLANRQARYSLAATRLGKIQALLRLKDTENQIIQQVRDAVREIANNREQIDAARESVRLAKERWDAEQVRRKVGFSTTFLVRDAEAVWLEAVDDEIEAMFRYENALAALAAAQGTLLEDYGILSTAPPQLEDRSGVFYDS